MQKVNETLHVNEAIISDLSIGVAANLGTWDDWNYRLCSSVNNKRENVQF